VNQAQKLPPQGHHLTQAPGLRKPHPAPEPNRDYSTSIQQSVTTQVSESLTPYSCGGFGYLQLHFGGPPSSSWADEYGTDTREKPSANTSTNNVPPSLIGFMSSSLNRYLRRSGDLSADETQRTKQGKDSLLYACQRSWWFCETGGFLGEEIIFRAGL
jgi:hypothetical protein